MRAMVGHSGQGGAAGKREAVSGKKEARVLEVGVGLTSDGRN